MAITHQHLLKILTVEALFERLEARGEKTPRTKDQIGKLDLDQLADVEAECRQLLRHTSDLP